MANNVVPGKIKRLGRDFKQLTLNSHISFNSSGKTTHNDITKANFHVGSFLMTKFRVGKTTLFNT